MAIYGLRNTLSVQNDTVILFTQLTCMVRTVLYTLPLAQFNGMNIKEGRKDCYKWLSACQTVRKSGEPSEIAPLVIGAH